MQMLILMKILYFRNFTSNDSPLFLGLTEYEDYLMIISSYVMMMIDDHSIIIVIMIIMSMVIIILSLDEIPLPCILGAAGGGVGEGRAGQDGGETGGKRLFLGQVGNILGQVGIFCLEVSKGNDDESSAQSLPSNISMSLALLRGTRMVKERFVMEIAIKMTMMMLVLLVLVALMSYYFSAQPSLF